MLEVAADEPEALRDAGTMTGRTEETLKEAAGFFIEQALFSRNGDYYRTLGGSSNTPRSELRRNMALIMRWLHPHVTLSSHDAYSLDKSLYLSRVSEAWQAIKTDERRAAYDALLSEGGKGEGTREITAFGAIVPQPASKEPATQRRETLHKQFVVQTANRNGFWGREPLVGRSVMMTKNKVHRANGLNTIARVMVWMLLGVTAVSFAASGLFGRQ